MWNAHPFELKDIKTIQPHVWRKRITVLTTIWALLIAVSSLSDENVDHTALLRKNEAVDQWNFFQSKNIKERLYEIQLFDLTTRTNLSLNEIEKEEKINTIKNEIARYNVEQKEIQEKAITFTRESEYYTKKWDFFELAQILFELAIILNTIYLIAEFRWLLIIHFISGWAGLVVLLIGTIY